MKHKVYTFLTLIIVVGILASAYIFGHTTKPKQPDVKKSNYVALGDSVAAGFGLETSSDSSACERTQESYPSVISKAKNYTLYNFACSGARLTDGILGKQIVNQAEIPAQIDQLASTDTPSLITLTAGANDIEWTKILTKCVTATCGDSTDTKMIATKIDEVKKSYESFLTEIKTTYSTSTPVVLVTGYYQVFGKEFKPCSDAVGITSDEATWWRTQTDDLNDMLQNTSKDYSFIKFMSIDFGGHELCSSDPWVFNLNAKAPYHPNDAGQNAIAQKIMTVL